MKEDYAEMYGALHGRQGGKYFPGRSRGKEADRVIRDLVQSHDAYRVLDYGSGKGRQYSQKKLHESWGLGEAPVCYDVGVPEFRRRPTGVFDGVLCCDMMEHIAESDVDEVLADIFSFADPEFGFVFFHISTRPSGNTGKRLPDGRDAHLTVRPAEWWQAKLAGFERPGLTIVAQFGD